MGVKRGGGASEVSGKLRGVALSQSHTTQIVSDSAQTLAGWSHQESRGSTVRGGASQDQGEVGLPIPLHPSPCRVDQQGVHRVGAIAFPQDDITWRGMFHPRKMVSVVWENDSAQGFFEAVSSAVSPEPQTSDYSHSTLFWSTFPRQSPG